jgi:N-acetylglutamate synthase-like GNAT family acetyltransferase
VRLARAEDAPQLASLLTQLGYPATAGVVRARLSQLRRRRNIAVFSAAAPDGRVIGTASIHVLKLMTDDAAVAFLTALVVHGAQRHRGVGRSLVACATEFAKRRGANRIVVTTHLRRANAHSFYERLGFEFTGRRYVIRV